MSRPKKEVQVISTKEILQFCLDGASSVAIETVQEKHQCDRKAVIRAFKIGDGNYGKYIVGRRGMPTRFEFGYNHVKDAQQKQRPSSEPKPYTVLDLSKNSQDHLQTKANHLNAILDRPTGEWTKAVAEAKADQEGEA